MRWMLIFSLISFSHVFAGDNHARIDLVMLNYQPLEAEPKQGDSRVKHPGWVKDAEKKAANLYVSFKNECKDWETFSFSFTPKSDGKVRIILKSDNKSNFLYKEVSAKGATVKNEDFSKAGKNGLPLSWYSNNVKGFTKDGKNSTISVNHDTPFMQTIVVKKDQPVTLTVVVKSAE